MKKRNILVFPCGSEIALDIYSSVKYSTYFHLIGASSIDDHGKFVYEDYIPNLPFVDASTFISTIKKIVIERDIAAVYPAMDSVITVLKKNESEIGCKVISSSIKTTEICLSKRETYNTLKDKVLVPQVYAPKFVPFFPCFAKPNIGYGAKGVKILNNQKDVDDFLEGKEDILILEYLPGEEYTVDCFTNKNGSLLYCGARRRNRIRDGISVNTTFEQHQEEFYTIAEKINSVISFRGAWFFQVKRNRNGDLCLLEIASRLGGSSLLSRAVGVNFALLSLFDAFCYDVSICLNGYSVELDRALDNKYKIDLYYDSVYCDYDDCLILEKDIVNTELISFLFQCVNNRKKIYLLSKHEGDLDAELKRFRIEHLFDSVYHLSKDEDKANYILAANSIFIDDSNAERQNVAKKLHIPVFSPDMIDVLTNS